MISVWSIQCYVFHCIRPLRSSISKPFIIFRKRQELQQCTVRYLLWRNKSPVHWWTRTSFYKYLRNSSTHLFSSSFLMQNFYWNGDSSCTCSFLLYLKSNDKFLYKFVKLDSGQSIYSSILNPSSSMLFEPLFLSFITLCPSALSHRSN